MAGIDPKYYYLTAGLLGLCTIIGFVVVFRLQRDVNVDDAPPTEKDILGPLEKAYYSGLMNEEEFQRIRKSMAKQKGVFDEALDGSPANAKPKKKPMMTLAEATETAVPKEPEPEAEEERPA